MTMTREQAAEYVDTINAMSAILEVSRGIPSEWLQRRHEYALAGSVAR